MVTVETFVEFIRKKDVGRIRFAVREALYDLDATDEVRTLHANRHSRSSAHKGYLVPFKVYTIDQI